MVERVAVSYLRISQDRNEDESAAVGRQREDIDDLAARRDFTIAREYLDDKLSAKGHVLRPDFEQLLIDIDAGGIHTVAAYVWDRLTRNAWDTVRLIDTCRVNRVRLIFVKGDDIDVTTPGGELAATVIASVARHEIAQKSERQRRQRRQEAEQGRTPPARRAFGYTARELTIDGGRYPVSQAHPDEAALVAEAYRMLLHDRTMGAIARWLNEQGSTTPFGRKWTHHNLRAVMVNPRYKGVRGVRVLLPGRAGERGQREEFHTEVAEGNWPALVTAEVWDAAQTILRDPGRRTNHPVNEHGARYLLPFIALCGVCGGKLVTGSRAYTRRETGERVHHRLLRCASLKHITRKAEPIEEYVEAVVLARFADPAYRAALRRTAAPVGVDLEALRTRVAALRVKREEATAMWTDGDLDSASMRFSHQRIDKQLAELSQQLAAALTTSPELELAAADDAEATWASWSIDQKRMVVSSLLEVVVLPGQSGRPSGHRFRRDTVRVTLKTP